jgi:hypothetical protein
MNNFGINWNNFDCFWMWKIVYSLELSSKWFSQIHPQILVILQMISICKVCKLFKKWGSSIWTAILITYDLKKFDVSYSSNKLASNWWTQNWNPCQALPGTWRKLLGNFDDVAKIGQKHHQELKSFRVNCKKGGESSGSIVVTSWPWLLPPPPKQGRFAPSH